MGTAMATMNDPEELHRLKVSTRLVNLACGYGYALDRSETTATIAVLRRSTDDGKLLVRRGRRGWEEFKNLRTGVQGSAIDLVQAEEGCRLGQARKILRESLPFHSVHSFKPAAIDSESDTTGILKTLDNAQWIPAPDYLKQRGLRDSLHDQRFMNCYRTTHSGKVLFPHHDLNGITGYELRDSNLKLFAKGGKRALWFSQILDDCEFLVIVESAIDAMSHSELYAGWKASYISVAGEISQLQKELLRKFCNAKLCKAGRMTLVAAFDNDEAGHRHYQTVQGLTEKPVERLLPVGKDWNDDLAYCNHKRF